MTGCKPTAGEVRECTCHDCVIGGDGPWRIMVPRSPYTFDEFDTSRIVEVAPRNRARVTAGPTWMRGER